MMVLPSFQSVRLGTNYPDDVGLRVSERRVGGWLIGKGRCCKKLGCIVVGRDEKMICPSHIAVRSKLMDSAPRGAE